MLKLAPLQLSLWQALYLNKHHNILTKCLNFFKAFPFQNTEVPKKLKNMLTVYLEILDFESADSLNLD